MKKTVFHFIVFVMVTTAAHAQNKKTNERLSNIIPFDAQWSFKKDSIKDEKRIDFNDAKWRVVDLPHDWSIEDLPNQTPESIIGPFDKESIGKSHSGLTVGGIGWYQKKFTTTKSLAGKSVIIHFDGVYMNSDVWINGTHVGNHPSGYSPFYYDLSNFLLAEGKENKIVVRVKNVGINSRWYSGSGIYRHVWLTATEPTHVVPWGVYITTPNVSNKNTSVLIQTTIRNQPSTKKRVTVVCSILSPENKIVATVQKEIELNASATDTIKQELTVPAPVLWSIETPSLYKVQTQIKEGKNTIDQVETTFGIRDIKIDVINGLTINGKQVKLLGGSIHHDNGPLGSKAFDRAEERKIEILKKNGFNAVRSSHNPPSSALLEACDRLGVLVIDEAFDMWTRAKNHEDYSNYFKEWWKKDLTTVMLRDRNHPSIFIWSIGNEITERADSTGIAIRKMLKQQVRKLDPSRKMTEAIPMTPQWDKRSPAIFQDLDVAGYNYEMKKYEADHAKFPQRIIMGTETYPEATLENYTMTEKHNYVLGDFVWTAFDYMGEASLGNNRLDTIKAFVPFLGWPWFNSNCGDIDLIGNKKNRSYYRDVVWRRSPITMLVHTPIPPKLVEIISPWGWPDEQLNWNYKGQEGKPFQVRVFSRAPIVRLYLNGKAIGEQKIGEGSITATFEVPYQAGVLKAVNIIDGKETDAFEIKTTGIPTAIRLVPDRSKINADRNDLSYVMVEVVDDQGNVVPATQYRIKFELQGEGEIAGVGDGSPNVMASFQQPQRVTQNGRALVIIRSTTKPGSITLTAKAEGLKQTSVIVTSSPVK